MEMFRERGEAGAAKHEGGGLRGGQGEEAALCVGHGTEEKNRL